jgi:hypothetical protein
MAGQTRRERGKSAGCFGPVARLSVMEAGNGGPGCGFGAVFLWALAVGGNLGSPDAETTLSPALPRTRGRERSAVGAGVAAQRMFEKNGVGPPDAVNTGGPGAAH